MSSVYEMLKILIVEDEEHTRSIIKGLLRQIGVKWISEASDGMEGFKEAIRIKPHLILCDIHMPIADGLTMLKRLRASKLDAVRNIPLIMLTADANRDNVVSAKSHGVNGYLVKPVSPNDLRSRIDAVLKTI